MKKTILVTALLAATGVAQAATTHTMTDGRFDFLNAAGVVTADGHDDVQGSFDMNNGTGSFDTSTTFNGLVWHADVAEMDMHTSMIPAAFGGDPMNMDTEAHTFEWQNVKMWDGVNPFAQVECRRSLNINGCAANEAAGLIDGQVTTESYSYNLTNSQFAAGVFFDWSTNDDIPVLAIMQVTAFGADGSMTVVSVGANCDVATGTVCGSAMVTDPFPGQTPVFSGTIAPVSAVPVPAAVWLFGSGLVGLAGVARRRKTA